MSKLLFAFVGHVSTEDNKSPSLLVLASSPRLGASCLPSARSWPSISTSVTAARCPGHVAPRPPGSSLSSAPDQPLDRHRHRRVRSGIRRPIEYSTIYPLLQHFGVDLWLPEIGGRVDYSSATHQMLLGMLGGTSKQERDLIGSVS